MDAAEFLTLSAKLVGMGKAGARTAISRAYYCVFHIALKTLAQIASSPPANGTSHALVPQFLACADDPDENVAARLLSDLHGERIKADYRLERTDVESLYYSQLAVYTANEFLKHLDAFRAACESDPATLTRLIDGIARIRKVRKF